MTKSEFIEALQKEDFKITDMSFLEYSTISMYKIIDENTVIRITVYDEEAITYYVNVHGYTVILGRLLFENSQPTIKIDHE